MLVISTKEKSSQETPQSKHHHVFAISKSKSIQNNPIKHQHAYHFKIKVNTKYHHACHFDEGEILARNSVK
jgi:hypothetical protein